MHLAKQPDATSFYCVITTSTGEQHFTKPFQYITENQHVTVPLHDELALLVDGDATVTVELRLRAEYRKAPRFNPQRMLRSASIRKMVHRASSSMGHYGSGSVAASNDTSTSVIASVQEETLCRIEMNVRELQQSCSASGVPVERKWTWKPAERFANADVASVMGGDNGRRRSHTRSQSRIMEVGHYLFSKFSSNSSSSDKSSVSSATTLERRPSSRASRMSFSMPAASDLASSIDLVEAGTLQMQVYCVGGLKSHAECALVPGKMSAVEAWLAQKQWFKTTWHKGYLSQQGGDVKNWRRRYFKIVGTKMEAYHEFVGHDV